jgi:AcrR family transcriptional regulator
MEDIVEATGVPRPTLYYHFGSKQEILAWLLQRLLRDLAVDIGAIVDRDDTAAQRLRAITSTYLRLFADHQELCTALLTDLGRVNRIPVVADLIRASFHEPVRKVLDDGDRDGTLRATDPESTVSAIFGAITMVGLHYVVTDQPVDVDALSEPLAELLLNGLSPAHATCRADDA